MKELLLQVKDFIIKHKKDLIIIILAYNLFSFLFFFIVNLTDITWEIPSLMMSAIALGFIYYINSLWNEYKSIELIDIYQDNELNSGQELKLKVLEKRHNDQDFV